MNYDKWKLETPTQSNEPTYCCESCNEEIGIMNESPIKEVCITCYKLDY